jgi:hypothetical protein|tara:strand:+ start:6661 stop:8295 length:1635 start_codon:yes stop_codon:yes gene_type:complete
MVNNKRTTAPTLEEAYDPLFFAVRRIEKSMLGLTDKIPGLSLAVFQLSKVFRDFASVAIEQQRNFLAFNKSFSMVLQATGSKLDGLPGGLAKSLTSLFSFQQAGLTRVSSETIHLANRMQITNQSMASLVSFNKKLVVQGTLRQSQTNLLNKRLLNTGLAFGVSTDQMLEGFSELGNSLDILGLTGGAGGAAFAISELTAKFPAFGGHIGKFVDALVTADIGSLANLGILTDVDRLMAGQLDAKGLEQLILKTSTGVGRFGGLGGKGKIETENILGIIGTVGVLGEQLARGLKQTPANKGGRSVERVFQDFRTALETTLLPVALEIASFSTNFLNKAGELVREFTLLRPIIKTFFTFMVGLKAYNIAQAGIEKIYRARLQIASGALLHAIRQNTVATIRSTVGGKMMKASLAGGALLTFGVPLVIAALGAYGIVELMSGISNSTEKLAEAAETEAKLKLREFDREDKNRSSFEGLTRDIINSHLRSSTLGVGGGVAQINKLQEILEATDKTTEAVDNAEGGGLGSIPRGGSGEMDINSVFPFGV